MNFSSFDVFPEPGTITRLRALGVNPSSASIFASISSVLFAIVLVFASHDPHDPIIEDCFHFPISIFESVNFVCTR